MKKYNKQNGRKNMRLRGYDYSRAGLYFLTIVVQNRLHLFGHVKTGKMILNDAGRMVEKWYHEIENKYPDKRCHEMVVMPNHFHCVIENLELDIHGNNRDAHDSQRDAHVGAPLRGHPENDKRHPENDKRHPENDKRRPENDRPDNEHPENNFTQSGNGKKYGLHNKKWGSTIGDVMDWFKTMTTNEYIRGVKINDWKPFERKFWQRGYYDHIIRNENDYLRIANYINDNPGKWNDDKFNDNK